jgi:hypothetical protein
MFKVNDKERMCKDNHDELQKSKDFYVSILSKLSDERVIKDEGSAE